MELIVTSSSGGEYDSDRKIDELKLLYRAYTADALSSGRIQINKVEDAA